MLGRKTGPLPLRSHVDELDCGSGERRQGDCRAQKLPAAFAVRGVDFDQTYEQAGMRTARGSLW
jgi:hypothetical protein